MDSLATVSTKLIDVQLKYDLEYLYIDVIDSGKGLSKEMKQKIFEKGYSTKVTIEDTGCTREAKYR